MISTARTAYAAPGAPTRTLRGTEYEVKARITQRLKAAAARTDTDFASLAAAVTENQRLWMTLALDVADEGNQLPRPLRAQLFWLYEFTEQHSRKVMAGEADASVLIDINLSVLRGLRGEVGETVPTEGRA